MTLVGGSGMKLETYVEYVSSFIRDPPTSLIHHGYAIFIKHVAQYV